MPSGLHTWSQTAASDASADSAVNWSEGQSPSSVNDSARAMMAVVAKWRDDNNGSIATAGTSTAYTITSNTVFTTLALMDNATLAFIPHTTSGATPTLNIDGLGAKVIRNATGVALPTGALLGGSVYRATYDHGNGEWLLHNQVGAYGPIAVAGTFSASGAVTFSSTLALTGDFAVNTNKFTVAASSGNTLVAGTFDATGAGVFASTLSATGNFAINTNKFNVTAASGNTAIAGTLAVTGASTLTGAVTAASSVLSSSASAGIGYATGAGGAVTQITSKSTGVTLNAICGQVTTHNANLSAQTQVSFTLTNSAISATDVVAISHNSGGTAGFYVFTAQCAAGSASVAIRNVTSASNEAAALVLSFVVIKAVTS